MIKLDSFREIVICPDCNSESAELTFLYIPNAVGETQEVDFVFTYGASPIDCKLTCYVCKITRMGPYLDSQEVQVLMKRFHLGRYAAD